MGSTGICVSGRITLARCGITVSSIDGQFCDPAGCTFALIVGARADRTVIGRPGDSGAPVYTRSGASGAVARGMYIGHTDGNAAGGATILAERISSVEFHLGVTVVTS